MTGGGSEPSQSKFLGKRRLPERHSQFDAGDPLYFRRGVRERRILVVGSRVHRGCYRAFWSERGPLFQ